MELHPPTQTPLLLSIRKDLQESTEFPLYEETHHTQATQVEDFESQ